MSNLREALSKGGYAELSFDGYIAGVMKDEDEEDRYTLFIQQWAMPAHFCDGGLTLAEVEEEMENHSFFPKPITWEAKSFSEE
jgi:hypothetical protein